MTLISAKENVLSPSHPPRLTHRGLLLATVCHCWSVGVLLLHFTGMTLCISFKNHWAYFLHERSKDHAAHRACAHLRKRAHARRQEVWRRYIHLLSQAGHHRVMLSADGVVFSLSFSDCSAHMDSGLVRPSILVAAARAPRWTCAVPCVYTRSLASVGNVYPAEVQQCWAFSQLCWTHWSGSPLGLIIDRYPGLSEVSRCIEHLKKEFLVLKLCVLDHFFLF